MVGFASSGEVDCTITVALVDGGAISLVSESADGRIAEICAAQRARCSRRQLLAARVDRNAIDRRVAGGSLIQVHAGVYALAGAGEIPLGDETAALLAVAVRSALSHHSAAVIAAIRAGESPRPVHVTIPRERWGPRPAGVELHRSRTLLTRDVRILEGLPVTSPARTLLDIAANLPERQLTIDVDQALLRKIVTLEEIDDVLERAGGHRGAGRLKRVRQDRSGKGAASDGERKLLKLLKAAGVAPPQIGAHVEGWEADLYWPEHRLNVEVDAYGTHTTRSAFEKDRRRDPELRRKGVEVMRFTDNRIDRAGARVVAEIVYELGRRAA
jgi:very-short-patch-repair endonuclease